MLCPGTLIQYASLLHTLISYVCSVWTERYLYLTNLGLVYSRDYFTKANRGENTHDTNHSHRNKPKSAFRGHLTPRPSLPFSSLFSPPLHSSHNNNNSNSNRPWTFFLCLSLFNEPL
ncbi:hypothetical protein F5X96DRAFT_663243 [Biscogniauxia mediterranea]|nr:hypothetical protein F5X96DRAFT_663243 [Biscogniauxia mediterranea]